MTERYLFFLGKHPDISSAEIQAVLGLFHVSYTIRWNQAPYMVTETDDRLNAEHLIKRLGGTIKIGRQIAQPIERHLISAQPTGKILFSLSNTSHDMAMRIKKILKADGKSVRYIEPKNTATILHNDLVQLGGDLTILDDAVFVTEAIQPIEALGARDYGRPGRDTTSGMLPPKLAQIMINLSEAEQDAVILDPFCGSGTILMEATLMGYTHLLGSDAAENAIAQTKKNLKWLQENRPDTKIKLPKLFCSDARMLKKKLLPQSVDVIVTEPYLGKPLHGREPIDFLKKAAVELGTLYTESLESFKEILKRDGLIVMIIPTFRHDTTWIRVELNASMREEKKFFYARPNQYVGREIKIFRKIQ